MFVDNWKWKIIWNKYCFKFSNADIFFEHFMPKPLSTFTWQRLWSLTFYWQTIFSPPDWHNRMFQKFYSPRIVCQILKSFSIARLLLYFNNLESILFKTCCPKQTNLFHIYCCITSFEINVFRYLNYLIAQASILGLNLCFKITPPLIP